MGKCPAQMWETVGFDADARHVVGQIFIQPAKIATKATGVVHPLYSANYLCSKVRCGLNQHCSAGRCLCDLGFYADEAKTKCEPLTSTNGCKCKPRWRAPLKLWTS